MRLITPSAAAEGPLALLVRLATHHCQLLARCEPANPTWIYGTCKNANFAATANRECGCPQRTGKPCHNSRPQQRNRERNCRICDPARYLMLDCLLLAVNFKLLWPRRTRKDRAT